MSAQERLLASAVVVNSVRKKVSFVVALGQQWLKYRREVKNLSLIDTRPNDVLGQASAATTAAKSAHGCTLITFGDA